MQNMILEALQLTLNNALDGSTALEAEIQNYPELLKVSPLPSRFFRLCIHLFDHINIESELQVTVTTRHTSAPR